MSENCDGFSSSSSYVYERRYFSPFLCTNLLVLHSKFRCSTHFALHNNSISAQKHPFSTFLRYLWVGFFSLLLFCSDFFSVYTKRPEEILYCLIIFHLKSILSLYGKAFWIYFLHTTL